MTVITDAVRDAIAKAILQGDIAKAQVIAAEIQRRETRAADQEREERRAACAGRVVDLAVARGVLRRR